MPEGRRLRILVITRNLPPLIGGMERLNWHLLDELSADADVKVIAPNGAAQLAPRKVIATTEVPLRPLWRFLASSTWQAAQQARHWQPDVVIAGSGLTAPIALLAASACRAKSCAYVHGLDLTAKHPVYRTFWLPAIRSLDLLVANSRPTAEICRRVGVDESRIKVIHPGVDPPLEEICRPKDDQINVFREKHRLKDSRIILSVGRLSARKGLREFTALSLPQIVQAIPDALLLIIGDSPNNALHAEPQSMESIQAAADAAGVGNNIRFTGVVAESELNIAYGIATVHAFPVRNIPGDLEGFGMVAVEAAAHGLPTIAFANGGVIDSVAEGYSGHLITAEDYAAFATAIIQTLRSPQISRENCMEFAGRFAWPEFGKQLGSAIRSVQSNK
ncbi:glycosyltransferase family 1 protein [Stenotrophomonas sp. ATCM1_4]|uniref:glycosyltransferase family 4 protein n=1 Tax=Stenotrophomonas sp. ATCM1_4 TaxID=2259330 RepID=UPI0010539064|nr:glycosyltransferase family 4 protein [Stenotrophomonas sp. ATCM1_4]TDB28928.1 glycosyltransferase family 1 protein [Stenotrophomonas sp. ATCM1_4]